MRVMLLVIFAVLIGCAKRDVAEEQSKQADSSAKRSPLVVQEKGTEDEKAPLPSPSIASAPAFANATQDAVTLDGVRVEVPALESFTDGMENFVGIFFLATTDNETRRYSFLGWSTGGTHVQDDAGNVYQKRLVIKFNPVPYSLPRKFTDRMKVISDTARKENRQLQFNWLARTLTSETAIYEAAIIDKPVAAAKKLYITFDGNRADVDGEFRFQAERSDWEFKPPKP